MRFLLCLAPFLFSSFVFADTLAITYGASGKEKIPEVAKLSDLELKRIGTGIRQKRVLINFNVYRASLLASNPAQFSRVVEGSAALESLKNIDTYALHLQFFRNVSSADVLKSFNESLSKNSVKDGPALTQFKEAIGKGGDIKEGNIINLVVDNKKGILLCEQGKSKVEIKGDAQFFRDIFSMWLGETTDVGLKNLKKALITGQ